MKLGFVSAILPDLGLEEVLAFAADEGFDCVELMCWPKGRADRRYAGVTHIDVSDFSEEDAARINDLVSRYKVSVSALGYYANPLSADPAEAAVAIEHLGKLIHAAALLRVGTISTFLGRDQHQSVDANWPLFLATWRPLIALAEAQGVRVAIENCPMLFTADEWPGGKNLAISPSVWRRMFNDIPTWSFGLTYDPSHLVWQRMDHIKPLLDFAPRLFHFHAKDCSVDTERCDDVGILAGPLLHHTPRLPGCGDVRWEQAIAALHKIGYTGAVCVEVEDREYEATLELRKSALRLGAAFLRPIMLSLATPPVGTS